ncbi:2-dehydro-3-deoxy-6-phosphogalactonate aldolase [Terrarubrum flagellatum]|uniref:2-dehydro-3-deoxy-6-phosphogalactonate aldolase n=1 Tax=Terrirubrum flagellatum TaxID=2895980 RepID=UPI0031455BD4
MSALHETMAAAMAQMPLVAILRGVRPDEVEAIGAALVVAGFRFIEVPLNSPDPLASIAKLAALAPRDVLVGAGTVVDPDDVAKIADVGGQLIISPHFDARVVEAAVARELIAMPGVMTPSEAFGALRAGAHALKLFPGEIVTPPAVRAMRAVLPATTKLLIVGGVGPDTMANYVEAGANGFGIGSSLFKPGLSAAEVRTRADALIAAARAAKLGAAA